MVSTACNQNESRNADRAASEPIQSSLGYEFAVLGLKARESRTPVIRNAAAVAAHRIAHSDEPQPALDEMLSRVATSTYRLLDPRNRARASERAQLSVYTEEDWDSQRGSRRGFYESASPRVIRAELA